MAHSRSSETPSEDSIDLSCSSLNLSSSCSSIEVFRNETQTELNSNNILSNCGDLTSLVSSEECPDSSKKQETISRKFVGHIKYSVGASSGVHEEEISFEMSPISSASGSLSSITAASEEQSFCSQLSITSNSSWAPSRSYPSLEEYFDQFQTDKSSSVDVEVPVNKNNVQKDCAENDLK